MADDWKEVPIDDWQEVTNKKPTFEGGTENGVPVWGQKNPNLYAATMTGLDLLPMIASPFKTAGIGVPVAGALNAAGQTAKRMISGEPTTGGDLAKDALVGMAGEGGGRFIGKTISKLTDIPAIRAMGNKFSTKLMNSAGKFGTGSGLTPAEKDAMATTMLERGYLFNPESHDALMQTVKGNTGAVDSILGAATRRGDTISADEVLSRGDFPKWEQRGESVRGVDPGYSSKIAKTINTFRKGEGVVNPQVIEPSPLDKAILNVPDRFSPPEPIKTTPYTPTDINVAKRQLYQNIGNAYKNGKVNDALETGGKELASAMKNTLEAKYPEIAKYNLDSSELLALEPYFARAVNRISQRDIVGLGEKVALGSLKDPVSFADMQPSQIGKLIAAVWDRPEIKSRVARMIYQKATGRNLPTSQWKKGLKYLGEVTAPSARAAFESELLTSGLNDPLGIR